ncbi:(E2-independent) E3 ubiquitin-conjugating enzyme FATS isoform X2 [Lagopus muta]|uniref:(E2-independent) E3 ubiquitin-conjugating enzyme FATS isoform X2 n=1 Tax=Lagopus muta TaxID=64668 RepID=UPI00209D9A10|nr:(E2-independent) E3 ubiquitin-conjugating enzyme FATS isoform X2 [Lagopus muta]
MLYLYGDFTQVLLLHGAAWKQWGGNRTCTDQQQESAVERKPSFAEESLSSTNRKLISPIVISQMIDETKLQENRSALLMQAVTPQPSAWHTKQSLTKDGSVNINSTFAVLASRLEIQSSLSDTTSPSGCPIADGKQCQKQKGFASITITARRVTAGSNHPTWGPRAVLEPHAVSPTLSEISAALHHRLSPDQANPKVTPSRVSDCCSKLSRELRERFFSLRNGENGVGLQSSDGREKVPPSFTSSVRLQVSQQCPNPIYYIDKSLNVCLDRPRIKCQKIYRSALSFTINCSSSRLTADGVDGIGNGESIEKMLQIKLLRENKAPRRTNRSARLTERNVINKQTTNEGYLVTKCPLTRVCAFELPASGHAPKGPNSTTPTKQDDDKQSGSYRTTFSLHLSNSSGEAGKQMMSGSQKKQCTMSRRSKTASASFLGTTLGKAKAATADTDGSPKKSDPSKGTSASKEIQAQGVLKPKMSISNCTCNIKASSRVLLEEKVHRQNQLLKSDCQSRGSSGKMEKEEEQAQASREALSSACWPGGPYGTHSVLVEPGVGSEPEKGSPAPLTLQEALEIHKPHFISRSQERLKKLEHMVQQRKAQQSDAPVSSPRKLSSASTSNKKKQYTVPDPLSDNLFKPKERFIPEKEMHMRSKRIYDNLPEVKKKQEEKQKRIIIQSNRMRVEIFKKQLLDQLLQRKTE